MASEMLSKGFYKNILGFLKTRTFVLRTISNGVSLVARFLADGTDVAEKDLEIKYNSYSAVIS